MRLMTLFLLVGFLAGCDDARVGEPTSSAAPAAAEQDRVQIDQLFEQWIGAYERGDADALAALFTEDAMYAANTGELLTGRDGIQRGVAAWMQGGSAVGQQRTRAALDIERRSLRLRQEGPKAYDLARFTISMAPPGCVIDSGHALAVLQKQTDGRWLIDALTVNRDPTPPPNACSGP